jgi:hypothetical protein
MKIFLIYVTEKRFETDGPSGDCLVETDSMGRRDSTNVRTVSAGTPKRRMEKIA